MMPMIYGEGDQAFSRLQQEIMKKTRDDSILAWGLNPAESLPSNSIDVVSGGVLATAPSDFENCGHIASREQYTTPVNMFDISGVYLRAHLSLHTTSAGEIYGLLHCGPEQDVEQVVGIPINYAISDKPSDEYVRPKGRHPILLSKATSGVSTQPIHIWKERQRRANIATSRRYWFYIEESVETNLEMIDVQPRVRWQKDRAMIATSDDLDKNITQRYLARFRTRSEGSRDIVVMLELEVQELQAQARCHVMTASRDTSLEELSQKLIYMRPEAFGKQSANNGILTVDVTVKQELVAGQPMFAVRLAAIPSLPELTIDATLELQQLDLKLKFISILQNEDKTYREAEQLDQQMVEKVAFLEPLKQQLAVVEENIRKLTEEKMSLTEEVKNAAEEVFRLEVRDIEIKQRQEKLSERKSEIQRHLKDNSYMKKTPETWIEAIAQMLLVTGSLGVSLEDSEDYDSDCKVSPKAPPNEPYIYDKTSLSWAATNGREAFVKLVLEREIDIELNTRDVPPLVWAAKRGYEAVVQLLLDIGMELELKDKNDWTPLIYAAFYGHEAVVKVLLEKGAQLEARSKAGLTPLMYAATKGHETVVNLLLNRGAELEGRSAQGGLTALSYAASKGHVAVIKLLLERGASLESRSNQSGWTPLSYAAYRGHVAVVRLLIDEGAQLEARSTSNGQTPLSHAADVGSEAVVKLLLEKGAVLETRSAENNWTPLSHAAYKGHESVVRLLLEEGAVLDVKDKDGRTPLTIASSKGHEAIVKLLLEKGAELETRSFHSGWTPISYAANNGHESVVKVLLEKGADLDVEDKEGITPLKFAALKGHETIVKLLHEKGAKK